MNESTESRLNEHWNLLNVHGLIMHIHRGSIFIDCPRTDIKDAK